MPRVTVQIPGLDRDCSSAVGTCLIAVGLLPKGTYIWTGNERDLLKQCGYVRVNLNNLKRGDILWKVGHTEMFLGNGLQGGARIDEAGGIHGYTSGDQTGREIMRSPYDQDYWKWESAWRYMGTRTCGGIPIAEATAQIMDHLIDHDAHGYSQDNREGSGVETIALAWDGEPEHAARLDVDGWVGHDTIWAWQEAMRTPLDGEIWGQVWANAKWYPAFTCKVRYDGGGSALVRAVQRKVSAPVDGVLGPTTVKALQLWLARAGYFVGEVDGVLGAQTAKALQRSLNDRAWS